MASGFRLMPWVLTFVVVAAIAISCATPSTAATAKQFGVSSVPEIADHCRDAGDSNDGVCFSELHCAQLMPSDRAMPSLQLAGELVPASTFVLILNEPVATPIEPSPPDLRQPTPVSLYTLIRI